MKYEYCVYCGNKNTEKCVECKWFGSSIAVPSMYLPEEKETDPVNHPKHYETGKFECIEVMTEVFGVEATQNFCLLNAFKYLYRCENKNNKIEDIKKSNWYINKFLELESVKNGKS